jgi:hypothetical protein
MSSTLVESLYENINHKIECTLPVGLARFDFFVSFDVIFKLRDPLLDSMDPEISDSTFENT